MYLLYWSFTNCLLKFTGLLHLGSLANIIHVSALLVLINCTFNLTDILHWSFTNCALTFTGLLHLGSLTKIINVSALLVHNSNSMLLSFFSAILIGPLVKLNGFTHQ